MPGQGGGRYGSLAAIIEAKGCWNPELDHAMETQLVGRYLEDNPCLHGLYLVGWFNCRLWDDKDYRKSNAPKISLDEARKTFDAQAENLSKEGKRIRAFVMDTTLR